MMKKGLRVVLAVTLSLVAAFFIYVNIDYKADDVAKEALQSDDEVMVTQIPEGYLFDGSGTDAALVFYPGGKVETEAYAPFMHRIADAGMDVFLVDMPFQLAFFDVNAANDVISAYDYDHWFVGGHSLGGAMAASFAAGDDEIEGLFLCGAYPTKPLDGEMTEVLLYGSNDEVVNRQKIISARAFAPKDYTEAEITGGNHAYFGNYGTQRGDGTAQISPAQQQEEAVRILTEHLIKDYDE